MGTVDKYQEPNTKNQKLLILHGWSYSTEKWEPFLKLLEDSNINYELLKIPGLTAPLKEVWNLADYVNWFKKEVGKSNQKVVLLGHSNGGRIVASFAAEFPEKVACLILIDSAGVIRRDIKTVLKKNLLQLVTSAGKKITKSDKLRNLLYKAIGEQDYNKADETLKKTMVNLVKEDLETVFSIIIVPTLIIWGQNDGVTPLSDGRKINKRILGSELAIIPGAKHSPQFTNTQEVFQKVFSFIKHYGNI